MLLGLWAMTGWKARIGMFIVSSEPVPEAEWWAMMPSGVSVHAARRDVLQIRVEHGLCFNSAEMLRYEPRPC